MQDYKELKVWHKSHSLVLNIYEITKQFPKEEIFGITSQLRRASYSIPSNIAEGCGKFSQKDFANFLQIALGSSNEVEYLLLLGKDLKFMNDDIFKLLNNSINEIKAMLINLIQKVRNSIT